jgi:hypothetical protein
MCKYVNLTGLGPNAQLGTSYWNAAKVYSFPEKPRLLVNSARQPKWQGLIPHPIEIALKHVTHGQKAKLPIPHARRIGLSRHRSGDQRSRLAEDLLPVNSGLEQNAGNTHGRQRTHLKTTTSQDGPL